MGTLDKLETTLTEVFTKKSPVQLPAEGRKSLAEGLWLLALVFGVLQLWLAWRFWSIGHAVDQAINQINIYAGMYEQSQVRSLGFWYYLSLLTIAVTAVFSLLAAPQLKAMRKAGWNLLFYGLLASVAYGVIKLFTDYSTMGDLVWTLLGSVVGAFLLFQVRDRFMKSEPADHKKK